MSDKRKSPFATFVQNSTNADGEDEKRITAIRIKIANETGMIPSTADVLRLGLELLEHKYGTNKGA